MSGRVLVATRSAHKLQEVRAILGDSLRLNGQAVELLDLDAAGIEAHPDEDGVEAYDTFRENALAKAHFFAERSGLPTIADDSGIMVHALDGEPGVRSRRFSGRDDLAGSDLDHANNTLLLARLADMPDQQRGAHYVCAAALVGLHNRGGPALGIGTVRGRILREPVGTGGFGYDPLFQVAGPDRSFGELPPAEKHRLSHRGRSLRALAAFL